MPCNLTTALSFVRRDGAGHKVREHISSPENCSTNYGLGIDTGGTYTDAVIVDLHTTKVLARSKARTTHHDLSIGLSNAVDAVLRSFDGQDFTPSLVGVSTTLATNTVLEKKGARVGLIGLGWTPEEDKEFGAVRQHFFDGGHDVRGRMVSSLDLNAIRAALDEMAPQVDAIAVSGKFSIYNSMHEVEVKKLVAEKYHMPVVMGHELTAELGIYERTVTAVLNAGLIPVLTDFLAKVQGIMDARHITAPIMVFKGDGTLMNMKAARKRPVDTLLSGPAASAMGGKLLAGKDDCIVIDIGGTSTDIAVIEGGMSRVTSEGSVIGTWPTRVEAINARTVALGGDSEIRVNKMREVVIGPYRVTPLCFAKPSFPQLTERMKELGEMSFIAASLRPVGNLNPYEQLLMDHLRAYGPRTMSELKQVFDEMYLIEKHVSSLWSHGAIEGIGLTPTDILHAAGTYVAGDREASELGLRILAIALGTDEAELRRRIMGKVSSRIAEEVIKKVLSDQLGELPGHEAVEHIIGGLSGAKDFSNFSLNVTMKHPLVGLGGPAQAFIAPLTDIMDAEVIVPQNFDVGNAIGAVCGQVSEYVDVFVYPYNKGYAVFSVFCTPIAYTLEQDAIDKAKEMATHYAVERAKEAGGSRPEVELKVEAEHERCSTGVVLLQMRVRARAVGRPVDIDDV